MQIFQIQQILNNYDLKSTFVRSLAIFYMQIELKIENACLKAAFSVSVSHFN